MLRSTPATSQTIIRRPTQAQVLPSNDPWGPSDPFALSHGKYRRQAKKSARDALKTLNDPYLSYFFLSSYSIDETIEEHLPIAVATHKTLRHLNLSNCTLSPVLGRRLAQSLSHSPGLKTLKMGNCNLGVRATQKLVRALFFNTTLTTLDLSKNSLTPSIGYDLARLLTVNSKLTTLNLSKNNLGKGGKQIAVALQTNSTLTFLDVSGNHLGSKVVVKFAKALRVNRGLESLLLKENDFGSDVASDFADALCGNKTISWLELIDSDEDESSILHVFTEPQSLASLEFYPFNEFIPSLCQIEAILGCSSEHHLMEHEPWNDDCPWDEPSQGVSTSAPEFSNVATL